MTGAGSPRVVLASSDARKTDLTNQLEHLVDHLLAEGRSVEVALVGDGERLRPLRDRVPVVVADRFRTRGPGLVASLLGFGHAASRYKGWRVRRWALRHTDATWVVLDPLACSFIRHGAAPDALVGALVAPGMHLRDMSEADRTILDAADLWLAASEDQTEELTAAVTVPVQFVGDLFDPGRHHLPPPGDGPGPVVISARSGAWEEVSHAIEVIDALHRRHPNLPIAWLADPGEDEWLARHDLRALDLEPGAPVTVVRRTGAVPPVRPRLLVRTSYAASDPDLAVAAAFEAIPTVGFDLGDLPPVLGEPPAPFDVEALVDQISELLDDEHRQQVGAELHEAMERWHNVRRRLRPLLDLTAGSEASP